MRIILRAFLIAAAVFIPASCATPPSDIPAPEPVAAPQPGTFLLTPPEIIGKRLSGSDNAGEYVFVFRENNVLEYTLNGRRYISNWAYNGSARVMRYMINWNENGKRRGYGVDIAKTENTVSIYGLSYTADAMVNYKKEVIIE